jgi:phosphocarrier protein HPr
MTSCAITVVNPLGLHARAAARFVHAASAFESRIRVALGQREIDGKSIMGLLLLAAARGTTITISAEGPDEREAIAALCALVNRGFDEASFDRAQGEPCA